MPTEKLLIYAPFRKVLVEYLACLSMQVEASQDAETQQKFDEHTLDLIVRLMQMIESRIPSLSAEEVEATFKSTVNALLDSPEVAILKSSPDFICFK